MLLSPLEIKSDNFRNVISKTFFPANRLTWYWRN